MNLTINKNLANKVVVLTGAGGVLCGSFAKECARQSMQVAILDLRKEAADIVANEIKKAGGEALPIQCDVLDPESVNKACQTVLDKYGHIDVLINGAGGNNGKATTDKEIFEPGDIENEKVQSFFDMTYEGFQFVFNLNFVGTFNVIKVFAQHMLNKHALIINFSSMSAFSPMTKVPAYSAAKAAISNFTQWLAVYFAESDIRVNAIAPGFFLTNQNYNLLIDQKTKKPTARMDKILSQTPMRKLGKPEDLFGTLLWLMDGDASGFVTGVTVQIDGGFQAYSGV